MDEASDRFRLAIGLFNEPQLLETAIVDLKADGVALGQMCLAGTRTSVDGLIASLPAPASRVATRQLLDELHALPVAVGNLDLVATDGELLHLLLQHTKAQETDHASPHNWRLPDLFAGLTSHLRTGAVALLVSAPDVGAQRRSSRILLRHSAHTVQTHEFARRRQGTPS
jgi:hypothetical protein